MVVTSNNVRGSSRHVLKVVVIRAIGLFECLTEDNVHVCWWAVYKVSTISLNAFVYVLSKLQSTYNRGHILPDKFSIFSFHHQMKVDIRT